MAGEQLLLPSQEALLHRLQHLASYGEQLVLLTGAAGAGKTALITALANELEDYNLALVACPQHASAAEIRRKIIMQLLPDPLFDDEAPLVDTLLRFVPQLQKPLHILLDDADNLPLELWAECLFLTQLQCAGMAVTLTLTAPPAFTKQLLPQLPQQQRQWLLPVSIEPLSLAEREGLYQTLLARAQQPTFTPRSIVIKQLEQQAGTPAEVLQLLQLALHGEPPAAPRKPWRRIISSAVVAVTVLAIAIWYTDKMRTPLPKQQATTLVFSTTTALPPMLLAWLPHAWRPDSHSALPTAVIPWRDGVPMTRSVAQVPEPDIAIATETSELLQDAAATADVATSAIAVVDNSQKVELGQVANSTSAETTPLVTAEKTSAAGGVAISKKTNATTTEPKAPAITKPSAPKPSTPKSSAPKPSIPKEGYTLQIASVKQQQSVAGQLAALPVGSPVWLCRNGPWWVIFSGHFSSRQQALQAAKNWQQQGGEAPWVRPWKTLQNYQPQPLPQQ
ncbi:AAA family ATPase [Shewanella dokdonensis]|uniref:AAA family ATPase n=1 Tax=Shewanella dokdonensis TaxID=712036 RepID=UPI00200CAAF5|nr:AAA family ATPase [Shewanella dokdonensis]